MKRDKMQVICCPNCGHGFDVPLFRHKHHWVIRKLRQLTLFAGIVWRIDMTGFRMSASTAWEVARIIHG